MRGGAGNDTYVIDNSNDVVSEDSNQGTDLVQSSVDYIISDNDVENLTLTGSSNLYGDGNASANTIRGNSGANTLRGGAGNDRILGQAGRDILLGEDDNDTLFGGIGNDLLFGDDGNDVLSGGSGNDRILGGDGIDRLTGGLGNDTLTGGAGNDIFQINSGTGRDVINDYTSGEDRIKLLGGITESDLTFSRVGGHTRISDDGDLLAIVQNTVAADITFI